VDSCITAAQALLKTVTLCFNTTDDLGGLVCIRTCSIPEIAGISNGMRLMRPHSPHRATGPPSVSASRPLGFRQRVSIIHTV
jgi:hypothetical protein